jgi:ABC-2 type transport system permease protein
MWTIYRRLWQVVWAEQWQYRANLLMYLLYWLVSPVVYLAVWTTVANTQGSVSGLTANDFITYYLTLLVVNTLTSDITIHILAYKIQDGTLAGELLKPVHPILTNTLVYNLGFKVLTMMALIPVWLVLCLLFRPDYSSVTWVTVLTAVPAVVLGFAINFLLGATVTCVAFWTTRVYALSEFFYAVTLLFAGQFVPLTLMPPVIQQVAWLLPFQMLIYFPVQLILGNLTPEEILRGYLLGVVWFGVIVALFQVVWHSGLKRFSAVGA